MKKIIASALALLLGSFGYTIVDKEITDHVNDLECSLSSMQEEIEILQKSTDRDNHTENVLYTLDSNGQLYYINNNGDFELCSTVTTVANTEQQHEVSSNHYGMTEYISSIPNVVGLPKYEAMRYLDHSNFHNIKIAYISNGKTDGTVCAMYPAADGVCYSSSTQVTLFIV